jgi:hypothetical protein
MNNYTDQLRDTLTKVTAQKEALKAELDKMEEDFSNVKLNPYGITSIDFASRQEKTTDMLKMEGVIMGLTLALETYNGATAE